MTIHGIAPVRFINLFHRDLGRRAGPLRTHGEERQTSRTGWLPAVDIVEQKERFVLRADLPGVDADAIDIRTQDGVLSLSGERGRPADETIDGLRRYERASGRFRRRFTLPDTADTGNITARSTNGVLEISVPKLPEALARRIDVEAA